MGWKDSRGVWERVWLLVGVGAEGGSISVCGIGIAGGRDGEGVGGWGGDWVVGGE